MRDYAVTVVANGTSVVLRATGDLNGKAASHLLELARSALAVRCSRVVIDLGGVTSSTRTAQRILTAGKTGRLPGAVRVRPEPERVA